MSVDEESTSCYCLLEAKRCHLLLEHPGRYALVGAPTNPDAAKRLRLAVFGCPDPSSALGFSLRVYCVDDTPNAFQVRRRPRLAFYPIWYTFFEGVLDLEINYLCFCNSGTQAKSR